MGPGRRIFLLMLLLMLEACSARGAIDAITPEADRAFAHDVVFRLRKGDPAWLLRHFTPQLWVEGRDEIVAARSLFPAEAGTTQLVGFHRSTSLVDGRTEQSKEFTLVTHGGNRWTVTRFETYSNGGRDMVVEWSVVPYSSVPPELAVIEAWDRMLPWLWAGFAAALLGGGSLIFWLVRRSRRVHDPWSSRNDGRP
jgi:hypothetical protein